MDERELTLEETRIVFSYVLNKKLKNDNPYGRRITQKQFAEMTGLTESTISRYRSGLRLPNFIHIRKFAQVLECSTDELIYFDNNTIERALYLHNTPYLPKV